MCDLKTAFFRFRRGTGANTSDRRQAQEPSFGIKEPFRGSVAHAYSPKGKRAYFFPEIYGGRRSENHLFSYTRLDGQKGQY